MGKDLGELASYMIPVVLEFLTQARAAGLDPVVEDTGRTALEQVEKLALNVSWTTRTKHLPQPPEMKSEAIDIVPRACMSSKYWGWTGEIETSHPHWDKLIRIGEGLGLHCGVHFPKPDPGHFQWIHK